MQVRPMGPVRDMRSIVMVLCVAVFCLIPQEAFPQVPDGGYASRIAWHLGQPTLDHRPSIGKVVRREHYEEVTFVDDQGRKLRHTDELWGVVFNDTLYLNLDGRHFVRMKEMGAFSYFTGPRYHSQEDADKVGRNTFWFGLIGGGIAIAATDAKNKDLIHYVMNAR